MRGKQNSHTLLVGMQKGTATLRQLHRKNGNISTQRPVHGLFTADFLQPKSRNKSNCLSTGEWLNKLWYIPFYTI